MSGWSHNDEPRVDFDWDGVERSATELEQLERDAMAHGIAHFLIYVYQPDDPNLAASFKRFVALTYILRPDLLRGRTIREISSDLKQSKTTFHRWVRRERERVGHAGINARSKVKSGTNLH